MRSPLTAAMSAVLESEARRFTSAPASKASRPDLLAHMRGKHQCRASNPSCALTIAFFSISVFALSFRPRQAAHINAVRPFVVVALTSAPALIRDIQHVSISPSPRSSRPWTFPCPFDRAHSGSFRSRARRTHSRLFFATHSTNRPFADWLCGARFRHPETRALLEFERR